MNFNDLTKEIVENIFVEIKKEKYSKLLKIYILEPSTCYIINKCYPYIIVTGIFLILILLIMITMFFLIIRSNLILKKY
jgi:hypothetical protein